MRRTTEDFQVNGKPMLAPDAGVSVSYEDIDGAAAGRDQAGVMHRALVRSKVPSWQFTYAWLTEAEKNYMESLFGDEASFTFTHPGRTGGVQQTQCYRSKLTISWKSADKGLWGGYGFTVIAL